MTDPAHDATVRNRYFAMIGIRIVGVAGAVFGLVIVAHAYTTGQRVLGTAIVISAMAMIAIVPRALARRWRSPPTP